MSVRRQALVWVEQILIARPAVPRERQRKRQVPDLLLGMPIGAEGDADTAFDGTPNKSLMRLVACRNLECDTCIEQRIDETLLALLGPEIQRMNRTQRHVYERGMRKNVDGHRVGESLRVCHERVHV